MQRARRYTEKGRSRGAIYRAHVSGLINQTPTSYAQLFIFYNNLQSKINGRTAMRPYKLSKFLDE